MGHLVASAIYQWDSRSSIGEIIALQFIQFWFTIFIYLGFLSEDIHLSRIQSNSEICLGWGCLGSVDADIDVVLMEGVKSCLLSVQSYFALIFPFSYFCVHSIFRGSSFGGSWLVTMESSGLTVLPTFPLLINPISNVFFGVSDYRKIQTIHGFCFNQIQCCYPHFRFSPCL